MTFHKLVKKTHELSHDMTIVTDVHNRSARDRESRGRALQRLLHLGIGVRRLGEVQVGAADPERRVDNHVPQELEVFHRQ